MTWFRQETRRFRDLFLLLGAVAIGVFPSLWRLAGTDYGVWFNAGWLINCGKVPYRDFWDHKTPGLFYMLALWQKGFGSSWRSAVCALIPIYFMFAVALYFFSSLVFPKIYRHIGFAVSLVATYLALLMGYESDHNAVMLVVATSVELLSLSLSRGYYFSLVTYQRT